MVISIACLIDCHMTFQETYSQSLLSLFFEQKRHCFPHLPWMHDYSQFTFHQQISIFPFLHPHLHTVCSSDNMCIFLAVRACLYILSFLCHWSVYYVYRKLNVLVCTNESILSFILFIQCLYIPDILILILVLDEWELD